MLERPLHTEPLTLRPATAGDTYPELFSETAHLATTAIVTLGHDASAPLIGDFMLRRENARAQLDVADQVRDTQALHREKAGFVRLPCSAGIAPLSPSWAKDLQRADLEHVGALVLVV